jgi:addiction module RelB/DinJ family antitoxin
MIKNNDETTVKCRINKNIKENVAEVLKANDYTFSDVIRLLFIYVVENRKVPFTVTSVQETDLVDDAIVRCRINREIKNAALDVLQENGDTFSHVIRMLFTYIAEYKEIPFAVKSELEAEIKNVEQFKDGQ